MWPRKQLDVGWRDFLFGLTQILSPRCAPSVDSIIGANWVPAHEAVVSLSVRTGWDLLLTALRLPPGSEIMLSAVTIPDMVRIIEHHGLVPVPVDVDAQRLEPSLEQIEQAITPRTRAILVAHLFGTRTEMPPIVRLAAEHDMLVIEDCAQAFVGCNYAGHGESDCAMFSFGPIKTSTALGGAVLRVRAPALRERMLELQNAYPVQKRRAYLSRLAKYAMFRLLSLPRPYGVLVKAYGWLGIDYDRALSNATHSFGTSDFFPQIRRRPCRPLLRMLRRRVERFHTHGVMQLKRRADRGNQLACVLAPGTIIGEQNTTHTYWVMPLAVANPAEVIAALRRAGFDATSRSSLIVVAGSPISVVEEFACSEWLANTVFVPNGHDMPDREWQRMLAILREVAIARRPRRREPAAPAAVTIAS